MFIKKILVLKETLKGYSVGEKALSGIATIELDTEANLYLSLINLASLSEGYYSAEILDGNGDVFSFNLGTNPLSFCFTFPYLPEIERGFACGIVYNGEGEPKTVAFSCSPELGYVKENLKPQRKENNPPVTEYDDEAVATENYYLKENGEAEIDDSQLPQKTNDTDGDKAQKDDAEKTAERIIQDEIFSDSFKAGENYFQRVKRELDAVFDKYPPENELNKSVPSSRWARVSVGGGKYYVVGVIYEKKEPKYICYGVPGKYSPIPPEELEGYASFLPLSLFSPNGDGYWVMFQSAETGKSIKIEFY